MALSNSGPIRQVHNSFARPQVFELEDPRAEKEDNYHFVTYLPIDGRLYELDGLLEAPIDHGAIEGDDWLATARPVIEKRINKYAPQIVPEATLSHLSAGIPKARFTSISWRSLAIVSRA